MCGKPLLMKHLTAQLSFQTEREKKNSQHNAAGTLPHSKPALLALSALSALSLSVRNAFGRLPVFLHSAGTGPPFVRTLRHCSILCQLPCCNLIGCRFARFPFSHSRAEENKRSMSPLRWGEEPHVIPHLSLSHMLTNTCSRSIYKMSLLWKDIVFSLSLSYKNIRLNILLFMEKEIFTDRTIERC